MLMSRRPAVPADTALDVAITVIRLNAAAFLKSRPSAALRNGTRNTPPPMPSSAPSEPATAPAPMTDETRATDAIIRPGGATNCTPHRSDAMAEPREQVSARLRERLDAAVDAGDPVNVAQEVKHVLQDTLRCDALSLPDRYRGTRADTYARRLLYRDPSGRYTIVVMAWGPGQRTALHDHAGICCVECVVDGQMEVTQYDL